MRGRYVAKSGRLKDALDEVVLFFEAKGLVVSTKENSRTVVSVKTSEKAGSKILEVWLEGDVEGSLIVTFYGAESPLLRNSPFLPMFGGGFFTLRKLKTSEIMERLEREFWEMMDGFMTSS